jgi:hypothetical protein
VTVNNSLEDLSERLADLVGPPPLVPSARLSAIRGQAAAQRRRRRGVLAVAAAAVVVGVAGTAMVTAMPSPKAAPATNRTQLLGWASRGALVDDVPLDQAVKAWDEGTGTGAHSHVRVLYAGPCQLQTMVVLEGRSASGQVRLGVLVSQTKGPVTDADLRLQVGSDVAVPVDQPRVLMAVVTGLRGVPDNLQLYRGCAVGLLTPVGARTGLGLDVALPSLEKANRDRVTLDPAAGYELVGPIETLQGPQPEDLMLNRGQALADVVRLTDVTGQSRPGFHRLGSGRFDPDQGEGASTGQVTVLASDEVVPAH